ncbi:hypothetical protein ACFSTE_03990 [Aquimarina hainanensis]|uniref:Uncharacterized protein n=1 Tax=Aquimarina hainanensis TaxID=1578017 RepID=A0ABW5N4R0_9FLAO
MKNLVIVFGVFVALFISSCETTNINDEIGEIEQSEQTELQGTRKEDSINPGGGGNGPIEDDEE